MKPTRNIALKMKPWWGKSPARIGTTGQLFKDSDRDGVPNVFDCKPFNRGRQDNDRVYTVYGKSGTNKWGKAKIVRGEEPKEANYPDYGFAEGPFKNKSEARDRISTMHNEEE
jgi:hypothetical protein